MSTQNNTPDISKYAYALIHFGSNPKYFELELYFCIMLKKYTTHDILYLYSVNDTPPCFPEEITPFVKQCIPFDDTGITYNVDFESKYTSFNTLRTCDFIFAYQLTQYNKICIIESDLVIMNSKINDVFKLHTPSILSYRVGEKMISKNIPVSISRQELIETCNQSGINGGIILIKPSLSMFQKYVDAIPIIAKTGCAYPNETLFEYVNSNTEQNKKYYNLPVIYNLSHYHTLRLSKYGLNETGKDIVVYHFNETAHKHLDIVKDNWIKEVMEKDEAIKRKYRVRKIPILFFEKHIYNPNKNTVQTIMEKICK